MLSVYCTIPNDLQSDGPDKLFYLPGFWSDTRKDVTGGLIRYPLLFCLKKLSGDRHGLAEIRINTTCCHDTV